MNRQKNQLVTFLVVFSAALLLVILLRESGRLAGPASPEIPSSADASVHLTMGNPSGATADPQNRDNYLLRKPYFALAYNNAKGTPNWVSWRLQKSDLGNAPRAQFFPDPELPKGFKHVTPKDYTGSGFDRGHLCPHSDRARTPEMSRATLAAGNAPNRVARKPTGTAPADAVAAASASRASSTRVEYETFAGSPSLFPVPR